MSNPDVQEAPVVAQARKEAKRLLKLARSRGWPEPKKLTEALDVVAQLKGQANWQAFALIPRDLPAHAPALPAPPVTARAWWTRPVPWDAAQEQPLPAWTWGDRIALVGRPGMGMTTIAQAQMVSLWDDPELGAERFVAWTVGPIARCLAQVLTHVRPNAPPPLVVSLKELRQGEAKKPNGHPLRVNVLDVPLGSREPTGDHREALCRFIEGVLEVSGSLEAAPHPDEVRPTIEALITQVYARAQRAPKPYVYDSASEYGPALHSWVHEEQAAGRLPDRFSWWHLVEHLKRQGASLKTGSAWAEWAHLQAMPTWSDVLDVCLHDREQNTTLGGWGLHSALMWAQQCLASSLNLGDEPGTVLENERAALLMDLDDGLGHTLRSSAPFDPSLLLPVMRLWAETVALNTRRPESKTLWWLHEGQRCVSPRFPRPMSLSRPRPYWLTAFSTQVLEDLGPAATFAWEHVWSKEAQADRSWLDRVWQHRGDPATQEVVRQGLATVGPKDSAALCLKTPTRLSLGQWRPSLVHGLLLKERVALQAATAFWGWSEGLAKLAWIFEQSWENHANLSPENLEAKIEIKLRELLVEEGISPSSPWLTLLGMTARLQRTAVMSR